MDVVIEDYILYTCNHKTNYSSSLKLYKGYQFIAQSEFITVQNIVINHPLNLT